MNSVISDLLNAELVNVAYYLAIIAVCIAILLVIFLLKLKKKLLDELYQAHQQIESCKLLTDNLLNQLSQLEQSVNKSHSASELKQIELEQVSRQLEHRTKMLIEESETQKSTLLAFQSQQPEDRLYSRALKLVKLGANVEEVMKECDLPLVEAEILLAIHNKKH